jgi:hypothetical protein
VTAHTKLLGVLSALIDRYRRLRLRLPQPWSRRFGQLAYAPRLLTGHESTRREFTEEPLILALALGKEPLEGVGAGLTERVVEIPWVWRRLPGRNERVLDIGTAYAPMIYKWLLVRQGDRVDVADLNEIVIPGLTGYVADVRALPFADDSYDVAVCLSTLEHVGMDNANYGLQEGAGGDVEALRELGRVAPRVLLTVPAGRDENMGWQRQYAPSTLRRVIAQAGLRVKLLQVFAHDGAKGWGPVAEDAVGDCMYGQGSVAAAAIVCAELARQ